MDYRLLLTFLVVGLAVFLRIAQATESSLDGAHTGRFLIMDTFRGEAVLDRTTQLIWERTPGSMAVTWGTAGNRCALKNVGGQAGWRLPSFLELMTLVEPASQQTSAPTLPVGHPFHGITSSAYWTHDTLVAAPDQAYTVDFRRADVAPRQKTDIYPLWCVQGGIIDSPQPKLTMPQRELL